jgi:predicted nucleic acid-binding protein
LDGYFFDTSALVKYYHVENGTPEVTRIVSQPGNEIRVSILGIVETQSAFAMKVRAGVLDRQSALALRARLMLDIAAGALRPHALTGDHFEAAEHLITRYAFSTRLRTLDALQLAVALDLKDQGLVDHFVAADLALLDVAALAGLDVINPESPRQSQAGQSTPP